MLQTPDGPQTVEHSEKVISAAVPLAKVGQPQTDPSDCLRGLSVKLYVLLVPPLPRGIKSIS